MKTKPLSLALAAALPTLAGAQNSANEMNLLRGRLEKQITEILALDAEIQSLSNRLGRESTPLPRREADRPAPEPAPLPVPEAPVPPTAPMEVRPAVPVEEPSPVSTPPTPTPPPAPLPTPDLAVHTQTPPAPPPAPTAPPLPPPAAPVMPVSPVTPVAPPPPPPVAQVEPAAPPPAAPIPPAPPVERRPDPVAPITASASEVIVESGDTLSAIARRHKTTVAELLKANPGLVPEKMRPGQKIKLNAGSTANAAVAPATAVVAPVAQPVAPVAPAAPAVTGTYVVQSGDTMHSIARRAGTTVDTLCRINGIANPSTIQIGMKLKLPDGASVAAPAPSATPSEPVKPRPPTPGTHIVKPGDTLSSISRQTNTPIDELRRVNNLKDDIIHPGQSLKVRRGGGEAPPPASGNSGASTRPTPKAATPAQGVEMAEYTVHLGDSIFSISKRYFLSREEVAAMNSLPVDAPLKEGQKIRLPASALIAARMAESESHGN